MPKTQCQSPRLAPWLSAVEATRWYPLGFQVEDDLMHWFDDLMMIWCWRWFDDYEFDASNVSKNSLEFNTVCRARGKEFFVVCAGGAGKGEVWRRRRVGGIPLPSRRVPTAPRRLVRAEPSWRVPASAVSPAAAFGAMVWSNTHWWVWSNTQQMIQSEQSGKGFAHEKWRKRLWEMIGRLKPTREGARQQLPGLIIRLAQRKFENKRYEVNGAA